MEQKLVMFTGEKWVCETTASICVHKEQHPLTTTTTNSNKYVAVGEKVDHWPVVVSNGEALNHEKASVRSTRSRPLFGVFG